MITATIIALINNFEFRSARIFFHRSKTGRELATSKGHSVGTTNPTFAPPGQGG